MMKFLSFVMILISQINAANEMMLIEHAELNQRIDSRLRCNACSKHILKKESSVQHKNEDIFYEKYSANYFCCPNCRSIAHIQCFFGSAIDEQLKCPNYNCALNLTKTDINKLFAQLLYVFMSHNLDFYAYKQFYSLYTRKNSQALDSAQNPRSNPEMQGTKLSHTILLDILIGSQTLLLSDQRALWKNSMRYFSKNIQVDSKVGFKLYKLKINKQENEFQKQFNTVSDHVKNEIAVIATKLCAIDKMKEQIEKGSSMADLSEVYNNLIVNEKSHPIRDILKDHFMCFMMLQSNPFRFMEAICIEMYRSDKTHTGNPKSAEFIQSMFSIFANSNFIKIMSTAEVYYKHSNQGIFMPSLLTFFNQNNMHNVVLDIITHQLASLDKNKCFNGMSVPNTIYILKEAQNYNYTLDLESIRRIVKWMSFHIIELSDEDKSFIASVLKRYTENFTCEQCIPIQQIFIDFYTPEIMEIYTKIMPRVFSFKNKMEDFM
ncbi:hypothetical protein ENBRE01_3103, partial [Enteropsectra breve]